jgi:hypothetical protein
MALRIEKAFGPKMDTFLRMQTASEIAETRDREAEIKTKRYVPKPLATRDATIEVRQTEAFSKWLRELRDRQARARIQTRIDRLQLGLTGDVRPVGEGLL